MQSCIYVSKLQQNFLKKTQFKGLCDANYTTIMLNYNNAVLILTTMSQIGIKCNINIQKTALSYQIKTKKNQIKN